MAGFRVSPDRTIPLALLRLVPPAVLIAWLAVAGYALTYLASH
jgi:hypothetical protein